MTRVVTLELPLPPSANVIWKLNRRTGRLYLNPRYKAWKISALNHMQMQMQKPAGGWPFFAGAFQCQIVLPIKLRPDPDNMTKPLLDFLQKSAAIIANDKHCIGPITSRSSDINKGHCRLFVFDAKGVA